jgi:hypothetical protein
MLCRRVFGQPLGLARVAQQHVPEGSSCPGHGLHGDEHAGPVGELELILQHKRTVDDNALNAPLTLPPMTASNSPLGILAAFRATAYRGEEFV